MTSMGYVFSDLHSYSLEYILKCVLKMCHMLALIHWKWINGSTFLVGSNID
jgi:hypothetical protein